jgi:NAD(P)H-flavin reductase/ferredoxin
MFQFIELKDNLMFKLTIAEKSYSCLEGETVLDALLREKVDISYICKLGSCQTCMVRCLDGIPPAIAQSGLKDTLKKQHYFLACRCQPTADMTIKLPDQAAFYSEGTVISNKMLNRNIILLVISFKDAFEFYAGQFVNLQRSDGLTRSYSIANIPQKSNTLEFHIRRMPKGRFSAWVHDELKVGDSIAVSEPHGHCFYLPDRKEQGLLLVGTGSGLAPLEGILTDALSHGHTGPICLFHGSREVEDLYKIKEMRELAAKHDNFFYTPCVSGHEVPNGFAKGRAHDVAVAALPNLKGWRVFLCGHPDMVTQMKTQAFFKGAAMNDIYTDAFTLHPVPQA